MQYQNTVRASGQSDQPAATADFLTSRSDVDRISVGLASASLKWPVAVAVAAYTWEVPVWRITFGGREDHPWPGLVNPHELTFHLSEFGPHTGVDLARLLREPDWRWPLFEGETAYPRYAWTKLAHETYEVHRRKMEALDKRRAERSAAR